MKTLLNRARSAVVFDKNEDVVDDEDDEDVNDEDINDEDDDADEDEEDDVVDEIEEFETWLETQPAAIQAKYKEQTSGLLSALRSERSSNKTLRLSTKELKTLRAANEKRKDDELTETERLKKKAEDAEAERDKALSSVRATKIDTAIITGAVALKFIDPETDAVVMIARDGISIGDDGKVKGVTKALKALAVKKPHLIMKGKGLGTNTNLRSKDNKDDKKKKKPSGPRIRY